MKRLLRRRLRRLLAMTTMLFCFAVPLIHAQTGADYGIEITRKLGRGLGNVLSSPLELPCGIRDEVSEWGWQGAFTGPFKALALFGRRLLVGVTEVGTFIIPMEGTLPPVCQKKREPAVQAT